MCIQKGMHVDSHSLRIIGKKDIAKYLCNVATETKTWPQRADNCPMRTRPRKKCDLCNQALSNPNLDSVL